MSHKLSDLKLDVVWEGVEKVDWKPLVDQEIDVLEVKERTGQHGLFLHVKFVSKDSFVPQFFSTGSKPVVEKLLRVQEMKQFPVTCKIVSVKNYFDLV